MRKKIKLLVILSFVLMLTSVTNLLYDSYRSKADVYSAGFWTQSKFLTKTYTPYTLIWGGAGSWTGYFYKEFIDISSDGRTFTLGVPDWGNGQFGGMFYSTIFAGPNGTAIDSIDANGPIKSITYRSASTAEGVINSAYVDKVTFQRRCLEDRKFAQVKIIFETNSTGKVFNFRLQVNQAGQNFSGTVYNKNDNSVLGGVNISLGNYASATDSQGRFNLNFPYESSNFVANFSKSGFTSSKLDLPANCAGSHSQDIYLEPQVVPVKPEPIVNLRANGSNGPIEIDYNSTVKLTWQSFNTNSCTASGGWGWSGAKDLNGESVTSKITSKATFVINCAGNGNALDSVIVNVRPQSTTKDDSNNQSPSGAEVIKDEPITITFDRPKETGSNTANSSEKVEEKTPDENSTETELPNNDVEMPSVIEETSSEDEPLEPSEKDNTLIYIMIGIVVIGGSIYLYFKFRHNQISTEDIIGQSQENVAESPLPPSPTQPENPSVPDPTVRVSQSKPDQTLPDDMSID